jgi:hypothetical protein
MAKNTQYVSETTQFLRKMLQDKPELIKKQKVLRHTWWDHDDIDPEEQKKYKEASVPVHSYAYYE